MLPRRRPNYAHIAELEHATGMDVEGLERDVAEARDDALAARQDPDWTAGRGHVLEPNAFPLASLPVGDLAFAPGQRWPVADPEAVQLVSASATVMYATAAHFPQIYRRSRVVLPPGVTVR